MVHWNICCNGCTAIVAESFRTARGEMKNHESLAQDAAVCEARGYHGPFIHREKYADFPGWEGMGDCALCRSTRLVAVEEARKRIALDQG